MLAPVITGSPLTGLDPLSQHRYTSNAQLLASLRQHGALTPVLVVGHAGNGKSSVHDSLLGQGEVFQSYEPSNNQCVFAYSQPISIAANKVLLMEMTGIDFSSRELLDEAMKLLYIALSACSGAVVCLGSKDRVKDLASILDVYKTVARDRPDASRCRFVLMVPNQAKLSTQEKNALAQLQGEHALVVVSRGTEGTSEQATEQVRREIEQMTAIPVEHILRIQEQLVAVSDACQTYRQFAGLSQEYCAQISALRRLLPQAKPLNLLVKSPTDVVANEEVFQVLSERFNETKKAAMVVILGQPGLGKSTLLNSLVSYLLRLRNKMEFFRVGNTTTHTTMESQVFPLPLALPDSDTQVMLVDLEGLQGTETINERKRKLQKSLVAAILAMASVPCIIVRNELASMRFVEEQMQDIAAYRDEYGLIVDRIVLLFYDKVRSATKNEHIEATIQGYKLQYGFKEVDIRIINKPSFVSASSEDLELFIRELVQLFDRPKKFTGKGIQSIADIMRKLREVMNLRKEIADLEPTEEEQPEIAQRSARNYQQIDAIFASVRCENDQSLADTFVSMCKSVQQNSAEDTTQSAICVRRLVEANLQQYIEQQLYKLRQIELVHDELCDFSVENRHANRLVSATASESAKNFVCAGMSACKCLEFCGMFSARKRGIRQVEERYLRSEFLGSVAYSMICVLITIVLMMPVVLAFVILLMPFIFENIYYQICVGLAIIVVSWLFLLTVIRKCAAKLPNMPSRPMVQFENTVRLVENPFVGQGDNKSAMIVVVGPRNSGKSAFVNRLAASFSFFSLDNFQFFTEESGIFFYKFTFVDTEKQRFQGALVDIWWGIFPTRHFPANREFRRPLESEATHREAAL